MGESVLDVAITHDGTRIVAGDWTGQVLVSMTDTPENPTPIAANPPSAKQRQDEATAKLAALVPEFDASLAEFNVAAAALATETQKRVQLQTEKQQKLAAAEAAKQAAIVEIAKAEQIKNELPGLTTQSRDQHDLVTSARLQPLDADAAQEEVAKRETDLANLLNSIASKRREQIASRALAVVKQQEEVAMIAAAEAMNPLIVAAEVAEAAVKATADAAKAKHDGVAAQRAELEKLIAQLAASI